MRRAFLLAICCLPVSAHANGAMGLGLELWDLNYWFAYVAAIIVAEAWLIGRKLGLGWIASLLTSIGANLLTGGLCATGFLAPLLHQSFAGPKWNPNPFLHSIVVLLLFAIPSAVVECFIWRIPVRKENIDKVLRRILFVHIITIPLALVILLIPGNPYVGIQSLTAHARLTGNVARMDDSLAQYLSDKGQLPAATTPEELLKALSEYREAKEGDEWALYQPVYGRFAFGDDRQHPWEFNPAMIGRKVDEESADKFEWYIRYPANDPYGRPTIWVNLSNGVVVYGKKQP